MGQVERFRRTRRVEVFRLNDYKLATLAEAQAALDAWVVVYNPVRPDQSIGMAPPLERFKVGRRPP
jgi:transposase InsO family protein